MNGVKNSEDEYVLFKKNLWNHFALGIRVAIGKRVVIMEVAIMIRRYPAKNSSSLSLPRKLK